MKMNKYVAATAFLTVLSNSPVAFAQTFPCFPLPPGTTTLPPDMVLPPGVLPCPPTTTITTTAPTTTTDPTTTTAAEPAPAPVAEPAPAVAPAPTSTAISGSFDEDQEGRGKKNGMDKGKKKGLEKEHENKGDNGNKLVMAGTLSGNTLTVTAIVSGHLEIGTVLSGDSLAQPVKIIAYGTGHGGVGTYTVAVVE